MKLSDYLLYRDIHELGEIASMYECECNYNSKLDLVQSIHHRMMSKRIYQEIFDKLDPPLLRFLTFLVFQNTRSFSIDELIAKGKYISTQFSCKEGTPRNWVAHLLKRGWLFPSREKYQIELEIPVDFHTLLRTKIVEYWMEQSNITPQSKGYESYRDESRSMVSDMRTFLRYLEQNPLPLTVDGVIHKRNQQLILQKMNVIEELIPDKSWRFGYGRRFPSYPNRFSLIYDFSYIKGWIYEEQGEYLDITLKGQHFLTNQSNEEEIHLELIQFWQRTYKKPIPTLPFIMNFFSELSSHGWIDLNDISNLFQPWLSSYYYDDCYTIFQDRIIEMLIHLGIVQISTVSERNIKLCRMNMGIKFN
jgi:hypothetical protein